MMSAKELAQHALNVRAYLEKLNLGPYERGEVLHVATSIVQVEIARMTRPYLVPQPVRDE